MRSRTPTQGLRVSSTGWIAAACALATSTFACTAVLGLDAPRLDPCSGDGCADASSTDPQTHDSPPANTGGTGTRHDASVAPDVSAPIPDPVTPDSSVPDTSNETPHQIKCGDRNYCNQLTETCCATFQNNGYTFDCISQTTSCPGVPISCARQRDCDGPSVCCATETLQSCVTRNTCTGSLLCDPQSNNNDCPNGMRCVRFSDQSIPYFFCH